MPAMSTYLENKLLSHTLRNVAYTSPANVYLACYTTNPTSADSGTEVSGGSYARPTVSFAAPTGGTSVNSADISIAGMPGVTITYLGLRDASSGGNLLFYAALSTPRVLTAGDTFTVVAGDLNVALS